MNKGRRTVVEWNADRNETNNRPRPTVPNVANELTVPRVPEDHVMPTPPKPIDVGREPNKAIASR